MPSTIDATYFPPLDRCLAGHDRLISWKTAYRAICDCSSGLSQEQTGLRDFLNSDEALAILSNPCQPWDVPGEASKNAFETKTAPIHVSHSSSGDYNIAEIKEDARWLSAQMKVEELVALRAAIVEWQQRPAQELLASATASEVAMARTQDMKASFSASTVGFTGSIAGGEPSAIDFNDEKERHLRLLRVYHEEQTFILKLSADLVNRHAMQLITGDRPLDSWVDGIAEQIYDQQLQRSAQAADRSKSEARERSCRERIAWIDATLTRLEDSEQWPVAMKTSHFTEAIFVNSTLSNVTDSLRLILGHLQGAESILGKETVLAWYRMMGGNRTQDLDARGRCFLNDFYQMVGFPEVSTLQCMVSMVSLAMLQLPRVAALMRDMVASAPEDSAVCYPPEMSDAFVRDDRCMKELNVMFYYATKQQYLVAGPAIFAWSKITTDIRDLSNFEAQRRDMLTFDEGSSDNEQRRRSSKGLGPAMLESELEKQYSALVSYELDVDRHDPPVFFASVALDILHVYDVIPDLSTTLTTAYGPASGTALVARDALLALLRDTNDLVDYGAESIEALLAVLSPDQTGTKNTSLLHLALQVADDEVFHTSMLTQAMMRYPYELSPLLRLFTVLAAVPSETVLGTTVIFQTLDTAFRTLTVEVSQGFRSYVLENEDENTNSILLTEDLPLFVSRQVPWYSGPRMLGGQRMLGHPSNGRFIADGEDQNRTTNIRVGAGSLGVVMKEERPMIIKFAHAHSALEYLGVLLSTIPPGSDLIPAPPCEELDRYSAAEILLLINALLSASLDQTQETQEARNLLVRLASGLDHEQDIVSVVADILEMELLAHMDQAARAGSVELLTACVQFLALITNVWADRVWSLLARSSLLGVNGGASAIAAVVGGSEVQTADFRFLTSCCDLLYTSLVRNVISGLVRRKVDTPRNHGSSRRFDTPSQSGDMTPDRTMSTVLAAYQRVVLDVFQSLNIWRFSNATDKRKIVIALSATFDSILRVAYGLELPEGSLHVSMATKNPAKKLERLSAVLMPAADMILEAFAPKSGVSSSVPTLTSLFPECLTIADGEAPFQRTNSISQTLALCSFSTRLMQTIREVDAQRASTLASILVKSMPAFALLLSSGHINKGPLSSLMTELVRSLAVQSSDPPSLLAGLNTQAAKSFLTTVCQLDKPLCDVDVECSMWDFVTAVLQCRQQWFAMYLLTGTLPKARLKDNASQRKDRSLLSFALDELSSIAVLNPVRAKAMLRFIAVAQKIWVWATNEVRSHPDFLKNTLTWLDGLQSPPIRGADTSQALLSANEHQMAAYMCDILAVNVNASLEVADTSVLKALLPKLDFLKEHAVAVNSYNRSLHRNLADNLARKFTQCELAFFRRTTTNSAPYGKDFYYDLELANDILGHETAWEGVNRGTGQGYSAEVARANINLSLVDAQMNLLRSWKSLASILSDCLGQDPAVATVLAITAERCLRASADVRTDEPGSAAVLQIRAELVFVLLSKLVEGKVQDDTMKALLPVAWNLVRSSSIDYDVATAPEDLTYYRTLLQVLYLAIQPHVYIASSHVTRSGNETQPTESAQQHHSLSPAISACLVDIVNRTIAPAFRALCGNLHNDLRLALPADFALITALLQAILAVRGVSAVSVQIAEAIANANIVRGALSLYSWADQLAEIMDQEPVYGEIAITFLLTMSKVPQIAEQMAVSGVLVQLSSANLSNYFRKPGGKGPFDEPRRMFTIWTEGFLPLCLNLLETVGPPIAAEVVTFLNSFPEQLKRAEDAFRTEVPTYQRQSHSGDITLGLVVEAHNLIIISMIVQSDMARGAAEGINAADVPPLAYDLVNAKAEVEKLPRTKRSLQDKVVPCNEREVDLASRPATGPYENKLMELVMREVTGCLEIFEA